MHPHHLLAALLPLALANKVTQISDGQIQEPAQGPAFAAPTPPIPTSTSTFTPLLKEAAATAANTSSHPAPAFPTLPILIATGTAPAINYTLAPHKGAYEGPRASASALKVLPVENGTAPTVPVVPSVVGQAPTVGEGSPREAGATKAAVATGVGVRLGVSDKVVVWALGLVLSVVVMRW